MFRDQGVNLSGSDAAAIFRDKDKDRDGKISFEEFMGQVSQWTGTTAISLFLLLTTDRSGYSFLSLLHEGLLVNVSFLPLPPIGFLEALFHHAAFRLSLSIVVPK